MTTLTKLHRDAILGRGIFSSSTSNEDGALQAWAWAGENDDGKDTLDQLVNLGLAEPDGRTDGFLTYRLTQAGLVTRAELRSLSPPMSFLLELPEDWHDDLLSVLDTANGEDCAAMVRAAIKLELERRAAPRAKAGTLSEPN